MGSDRSFLVSVQPFHLNVALIAEEVNHLVDCLVVDSLDNAPVGFGGHFGKLLRDVVIVDAMLAEGESDDFLFLILLFLFFLGNVAHPFCFP